MRLLSAIACDLDLDLCNFNADQIFVQPKVDNDIFPRLLKGCGSLSGKLVRLSKSMYG